MPASVRGAHIISGLPMQKTTMHAMSTFDVSFVTSILYVHCIYMEGLEQKKYGSVQLEHQVTNYNYQPGF